MRKVALSLVAAVALFVPLAQAAPVEVLVKDNFFKPERVKVRKGGKVVWRWKGSNPHNVALKKPGSRRVARRSALKVDGKFTHRFRRVGKWRAICEVHPRSMRMRVVVKRP
jgi:plastocyanin